MLPAPFVPPVVVAAREPIDQTANMKKKKIGNAEGRGTENAEAVT